MSSISKHIEGQLPETLVSLLQAHAKAAPLETAYIYLRDGRTEDVRLSYSDLDRRSRALAAELQAQGARPGERALLLFPAGVEALVALFGCLYAGVIAVPVPAPEASRIARTLPRLKAIANDADASVLISCAPILAAIDNLPDAAGALGSRSLDVACVDESLACTWRRPAISGDTLAYLQYTSGSTSAPRGVCITHAHLLQHLEAIANYCGGYSPKSVTVNWMPYFHDYGLVEGMLLPLFNRTLCVLMSPYALIKQPANWLRAISRYRATHSQAPNFAYAHCSRRIDPTTLAELDLSHWRCAGIGAEPINPDAMAAFARMFEPAGFQYGSFNPCYGLAEATLVVTHKDLAKSPRVGRFDREALERGWVRAVESKSSPQVTREIVSCGRPLKGTVVVIANPETRKRVPSDSIGEIWVSSPAVAGGYWQREEATAETFHARLAVSDEGPFLRTGDLGFFYEGELFVCGRLKDLIIIHGQNISPQDIEWTVQEAHPALKPESGAAFSVEIDGEERLVVAQEVQGKLIQGLDEAAAFAAIRSAVSETHGLELHAIVLLRSGGISKTSSGKIQRSACREMFSGGTLNVIATWRRPPDTDQAAIRPVFSERPSETAIREFVLSRIAAAVGWPAEAIDPREPFARFGLDSVRAVSLVGELEAWLGRELPATLAFDYPNAAALARHLGANERGDVASVPLMARGRQPIAIVGVGCRFPGGINGPEQFWDALRAGFDGVREVPMQRWDADVWYAREPGTPGKMNTRWGGFIDDVDAFDASFFSMSPREAHLVDPQQRILLEVTWEALEHAGIAADRLAGSRTGVYVGICSNDYQRLQGATLQDGYAATGNALSIAANRISYTLDLVGPSWAVDTACSSSLVAVHQACRDLHAGEADLALAGGVNLVLDPAGTVAFSQARMMSPTGRCRTFSDDADGYVRAEGCGMVVLKRLADATRAGDRIIAVIRGSAVNQDGRSNGLTAPSGPSQQGVVRAALANAGVAPAEVGYVEAHGTGTPLGDPIELNALAKVLSDGRAPAQRCWVGSVKSNIGHLEGAAGIAGLIKAALCVEHGEIPRNLHFRSLNPHVRIEGTGLGVPTRAERWPGAAGSRIAGVSSFGFGGTNAHVILEEPPARSDPVSTMERPRHLLTLSAKSQPALEQLIARYQAYLIASPGASLPDICYTANTGRSSFPHRVAVAGATTQEMVATLQRFMADGTRNDLNAATGKVTGLGALRVAFEFSRDGCAYRGMGRRLFETSPAFATALQRCRMEWEQLLGEPFETLLDDAVRCERSAKNSVRVSAAQYCVQYALAELWRSWGIEPEEIAGRGVGMLAAGAVAGVFDVRDGLALAIARASWLDEGAPVDTSSIERQLRIVHFSSPRIPIIAGIDGEANGESVATRAFWLAASTSWRENIPVWPSKPAWEYCIAIGAGSSGDGADAGVPTPGLMPGLNARRDEWEPLLESLVRLHVAGAAIDWAGLDLGYSRIRVSLPTYPFLRTRYWFNAPASPAKEGVRAPEVRQKARGYGSDAVIALTGLPRELPQVDRKPLLAALHDHTLNHGARPADPPTEPTQAPNSLTDADLAGLTEREAEELLLSRLKHLNY